MSLLDVLGITAAHAAPQVASQQPASIWSMLWLPLLLIVVFYFLLIRPQSKRTKEHRALLEKLSVGDEIVTTAGIVARVTRLKDNYLVLEIAKGVEITLQKASVASVLPKGTLDSI